jgi:DNA-binding NarL/FixJ family response regulator
VCAVVTQLVVLAVDLPDDGFQAAADIGSRAPMAMVVMLTDEESDEELFRAVRAGARGYLRKSTKPSQLTSALRGVLTGEAALSRTLAAHLMDEFRQRDRRDCLRHRGRPGERLTQREWDVLELLECGLPTAAIADRLYVAKVTVRSHVASIVHKLDVADRAAAVHLLRSGSHA